MSLSDIAVAPAMPDPTRRDTVMDMPDCPGPPKPTILHVITELGSGGAERMLLRLVTAATRHRHVVVSLSRTDTLNAAMCAAGAEVHSLGMKRDVPSIPAIFRLARIIQRERPAVVQTWLYHADLTGLIAARLANIGTPVAWNLRCSNMDLSKYRWSTRLVVKLLSWISSWPDVVMVNSLSGKHWHVGLGYRPKRWELVPNGVNATVFHPDLEARARWRQRLNVQNNEILVGMVARRDPMKDHEGMLRAAANAARDQAGLAFVLAGSGVTRADPVLARLADDVGAPVHLIGERDDTAGLNAALDIAVLSSAFGEGFPNVVAEAMATAVPCVVTDVGDAAAIIDSTGVVVPPGDPAALAGAIVALAANRPVRTRLGETARRRIREHYSLTAATERYETLWQRLAATRSAQRSNHKQEARSAGGFSHGDQAITSAPTDKQGHFRKALWRGLPIVVTVAALAAVLSRLDLRSLWGTAATLQLSTFALVVSALLVGNLLACLRFKIIAGALHQPVRLRDAFAATSLGQLAGSIFFQAVGQTLARSAVLSKAGVSMPTTIIITGYERIVAALVSAALALFGALYLFQHITLDLAGGGDELLEIIAGIAFVGFAGAAFAWGSKAKRAIRSAGWKHAAAAYLRASSVTLLIQMATMIAYLAAATSLSPSIALPKLVAAMALVMFAASVPISLAGWGIREISAIYALGAIGMPSTVSVVVALLIGFSSIVVMAAMALIGASLVIGPRPHLRTARPVGAATLHSAFLNWVIPVFVASAVFFQIYVPVGIGKLNVNLADSVILFGGALFIRHLVAHKTPRSDSRVPGLGFMVSLMTATISVAFVHGWIVDGWTAWASTNRMFGWFVLLAYASTGALLASQKDTSGWRMLLKTFVVSGVAIATFELFLLFAVAAGIHVGRALLAFRIDGFAQNPNAFGFQLLLVIVGIFAIGITNWRHYAALTLAFVALYFTASRGAEGTFIIVCGAAMALHYIRAKSLAMSLLCALGVVLAIHAVGPLTALIGGLPHTHNFIAGYFDTNVFQTTNINPHYKSNAERWLSLVDGLQMFLAHPLFGAGLGAFVDMMERQRHEFLIIHSTPIWLLAETGIVGFTIFVAPYFYVLRREIRASLAGDVDSARILLVLSLIAFGAMSQVHDLMYQRAFWLLLGAAVFSPVIAPQRKTEHANAIATVGDLAEAN
jgi:glycosyltransferase involved in cell wall biosynthesis